MIPKEQVIEPGMIVRHDEGLLYRVDDLRQSTIGYEKAHELGGAIINYTQLQDGQKFPAGTKYGKDEAGFRDHFTVEPESETSREFERLVGQIELSEQDVVALKDLCDRNQHDIRFGIIDVKCYAFFLNDQQLAERLAELEWDTDPFLNKRLTIFPVTETFEEMDSFYIPTLVNGDPIDDSFTVKVFNTETGKMFCIGFGPELSPDEALQDPHITYQYSYGFVADYKTPGLQQVNILTTPDNSNQAIEDIRLALLEEFSQ